MSNENPAWVQIKELAASKPSCILKMSLEELDFRISNLRAEKKQSDLKQEVLKNLIWSRVAVLEVLEVRDPQFTNEYYEVKLAEWSKVAE